MSIPLPLPLPLPLEIGFTGTQHGMSQYQQDTLKDTLLALATRYPGYFHHGDCIGADEQASEIAMLCGYPIYLHPPINPSKRAFCFSQQQAPPAPYLKRNHQLVDAIDILIATPGQHYEVLRSGTWATVRYARKLHKEILIIGPPLLPYSPILT